MIRLRGASWDHPRGHDCLVAAAEAYRAVEPDVVVEWRSRSLQAFADAPLDALAAEYDLLVIDHPHVPLAAAAGVLAPLDGHGLDDELATLAEQSVGASHRTYASAGRQWGVATDAAAQVSAWRPDLIAEPPTTWDGVLELAREGRVLWPAKPIDAFSSAISVAGAQGWRPGPGAAGFPAGDDLASAVSVLHALADAVPPANLEQNPIEVSEALAAADRACFSPLLFGYSNYARAGFRAHRLRYRDAPAGAVGFGGALLGGAGVAVSARSAHVDAARRFAVFAASADVQAGVYFDAGGQPGNAAAWEDERLAEATADFFRATRATLEQAFVRPRVAGAVAFQDRIGPLLLAALRREIDDDTLVAACTATTEELLTDADG